MSLRFFMVKRFLMIVKKGTETLAWLLEKCFREDLANTRKKYQDLVK